MKTVNIEEQTIHGLSIRTTNASEMNPDTAKIPSLYQTLDSNIAIDYKNGERVYAVYYNYASDAHGEFSVLAGSPQAVQHTSAELDCVTITKGQYLLFAAKGDIPQIVIATWIKVWNYFAQPDCPYQRAYTTDFEFYKNQHELEIYIAVI